MPTRKFNFGVKFDFQIKDHEANRDECKDAKSNKCWTPVQSLRCHKQHCSYQSKHV